MKKCSFGFRFIINSTARQIMRIFEVSMKLSSMWYHWYADMTRVQSCYINLHSTPSSPTYLPLPAVEHLLSNSSATVVRCSFTGEAEDIEQNLRPCIRRHSSNYMELASTESQNSYLHWTVFSRSKDSSVHSWLISWLTPAPLTRYFHWLMNDWLILQ